MVEWGFLHSSLDLACAGFTPKIPMSASGAFGVGGLKGNRSRSKVLQGWGGRRGEQSPTQSLQLPFHLVQLQWDEEKPLFCHTIPLLTPTVMEDRALFTGNCLSEGKLKASTMDSSYCLHGSVKSTNVPTTAPAAHLERISETTRDMALEHLLKYLPELWLRLPQNLRRTENCLRGGTWKQRGHFSEYGLTGWETKPHFTPTHPHEGSCKAWRFPASAHAYATTHLSCCVRNTRNPKH